MTSSLSNHQRFFNLMVLWDAPISLIFQGVPAHVLSSYNETKTESQCLSKGTRWFIKGDFFTMPIAFSVLGRSTWRLCSKLNSSMIWILGSGAKFVVTGTKLSFLKSYCSLVPQRSSVPKSEVNYQDVSLLPEITFKYQKMKLSTKCTV